MTHFFGYGQVTVGNLQIAAPFDRFKPRPARGVEDLLNGKFAKSDGTGARNPDQYSGCLEFFFRRRSSASMNGSKSPLSSTDSTLLVSTLVR